MQETLNPRNDTEKLCWCKKEEKIYVQKVFRKTNWKNHLRQTKPLLSRNSFRQLKQHIFLTDTKTKSLTSRKTPEKDKGNCTHLFVNRENDVIGFCCFIFVTKTRLIVNGWCGWLLWLCSCHWGYFSEIKSLWEQRWIIFGDSNDIIEVLSLVVRVGNWDD